MLTRNVIIFCTLAILLAEADLDAVNEGLQAMSTGTDQDSTSDEAPTESMNSVSPDQPSDESQHDNAAPSDASSTSAEAGQAAGPEVSGVTTADGAKSSIEEQEENESPESEEVKAVPVQHATKSQTANQRKRSKPVVASKKRTRPVRP